MPPLARGAFAGSGRMPFDKEADTRPDRGSLCPRCNGDGERLVKIPSGTRKPRRCETCKGLKVLTSEELAEYRRNPPPDDD